jgi:hypothetical protein
MPYVLVLLREGSNLKDEPVHAAAHERFISSLIRRNLVLIGGGLDDAVDDVYAAYVLRCGGVEEASAIAAEDPFVVNDVVRPQCVEWNVVGVNPDAIDASTVVRPEDIYRLADEPSAERKDA